MKFSTALMLCCASFSLVACKADQVTVDLSEKQLDSVISGVEEGAEFRASFEFSGELDESKKADISRIESIVRSKMDIEDFEVTGDGSKTQIEITGTLPIVSGSGNSSPWYISVEPYVGGSHIVSLKNGTSYNDIASAIEDVEYIYKPDSFHPTTVKFRADGATITVPAGYVDGDPKVMFTTTVSDKLSMRFADGIFDDVGATFIYVGK